MTAQLTEPPCPITDPSNPNIQRWPTLGLTLIHEFITPSQEATMIQAFHAAEAQDTRHAPNSNTKKRVSQHFGHHFDYTTFGASSTNFTPIPDYITEFLSRLPIQSYLPDQFTVQYYPPGAGIPPHVDTHSMFAEALYSLSFGGDVPMVFRLAGANDARKMRLPKRSLAGGETGGQQMQAQEPEHPSWELMLPRRSLLLMMGSSRYGYTHGIRARKTDVVEGRTVQREGRYSITMRTVRRGEEIGCGCEYPGVCDARIREEMAKRGTKS